MLQFRSDHSMVWVYSASHNRVDPWSITTDGHQGHILFLPMVLEEHCRTMVLEEHCRKIDELFILLLFLHTSNIWQSQNLSTQPRGELYCTVLYYTVLYCTIQYCAILWALVLIHYFYLFTHAPCRSMGQQMDIFSSSFSQPPNWQRNDNIYVFLLGTENAVGGVGLWQCMPYCFIYFRRWGLVLI